jgi:hypothetical protein
MVRENEPFLFFGYQLYLPVDVSPTGTKEFCGSVVEFCGRIFNGFLIFKVLAPTL